ncbi:type II secretion system protein [Thermus sp.]|uniref:prepilin-type N-terminal cleavage/methylation domain-containing protein n=1 Tax=Thermus sp. TaxID=275 RepID=UPI0025E2FC91|nr:type II secretion system protein [Thermus sp.]MCS6869513.1 type II secretion system GspH family protein [Thermus sp.]
MRKGFSLTELLVAVGILLLLTAMGVRWVGSARDAAREREAQGFGREMTQALQGALTEVSLSGLATNPHGWLWSQFPTGSTTNRTGGTLTASGNIRLCENPPTLTGLTTRFPRPPSYVGCALHLITVQGSLTAPAQGTRVVGQRLEVHTWVKGRGRKVYVAGQ